MKLIIQIPCHNEAATLAASIADFPRSIPGIDIIETMVIDDGSTDGTELVARELGIQHIVSLKGHKGLAQAFTSGIEEALWRGADIIVNTDGDNQYCGGDIPALVAPIVQNLADVVIGDRQVSTLRHYSAVKRLLHKMGNRIIRLLAKTDIPDAISGFRAYSREAALRTVILTDYSYSIENLIQLSKQKLRIVSVPVSVHTSLRKSRLIKNIPHFLGQQGATIIRTYSTYSPVKVFLAPGLILILLGAAGLAALLWLVRNPHPAHWGVSALSLFFGFLLIMFGIIAELTAVNRKLIITVLYKIKQLEMSRKTGPGNED